MLIKKRRRSTTPNQLTMAWDSIRDPDCEACELCDEAEHVCLIGRGPTPCKIMIIGEAPGQREDDIGKPFAGKAGQLLDTLLAENGIDRSQVYITNAVKCRPPDNRTPTKPELKACAMYLQREFELVKPQYVLLLGATAFQAIFNKKGVMDHRGQVLEHKNYPGVKFIPTVHPAATFRRLQWLPFLKADVSRFASLIKGTIGGSLKPNTTIVDSIAKLRACIHSLNGADVISYDLETSGKQPMAKNARIFCIGLAVKGKQWIIPMSYPGSPFWKRSNQVKIIEMLQEAMNGKILVAHNGKFDNKWLKFFFGWDVPMSFCTMLASYILDENSPHGLKPLSSIIFNAPDYDLPQPVDPNKVSLEELAKYCGMDVMYTLELYPIFRDQLNEDKRLKKVFDVLLMPASKAMEDVELEGVYIDPERYTAAVKQSEEEIASCLKALNSHVKYEVNWNSPDQIAKLLFGELKIKPLDLTGTGKPSTSESVLLRLSDKHPVVKALLEYRNKIKLNQFLASWKEHLDENWRIHPSFLLHGTVTGRLSCAEPNLQQVPRDPFIRSLITAPPGWVLVEIDYSQVELRIAAMLANERTMLRAFQTGVDVHKLTASKTSGKPIEELTKEDRKKAKPVNFGFLYGMWWRKFIIYARDNYGVDFTEKEAQQFREDYFELYNQLPAWHERQRRLVKKYKYVRTPIGRKRRLPEIDSDDKMARGEAERQAINTPVQSFASDLTVYNGLIRSRRELPRDKFRSVGLVHDALLAIIREDVVEEYATRICNMLTDMDTIEKVFGVHVTVPIEVECKIGPWGAGKVFTAS